MAGSSHQDTGRTGLCEAGPERIAQLWEIVRKRILVEDRGHTSDCWVWQGTVTIKGYGMIHLPDLGNLKSHRLTYSLTHGAVPDGLHVDHLCRVKGCCNPEHLEAVTNAENARRKAVNRPHCLRGHLMLGTRDGGRWRLCLTCRKERQAARRRRDAASATLRAHLASPEDEQARLARGRAR